MRSIKRALVILGGSAMLLTTTSFATHAISYDRTAGQLRCVVFIDNTLPNGWQSIQASLNYSGPGSDRLNEYGFSGIVWSTDRGPHPSYAGVPTCEEFASRVCAVAPSISALNRIDMSKTVYTRTTSNNNIVTRSSRSSILCGGYDTDSFESLR